MLGEFCAFFKKVFKKEKIEEIERLVYQQSPLSLFLALENVLTKKKRSTPKQVERKKSPAEKSFWGGVSVVIKSSKKV